MCKVLTYLLIIKTIVERRSPPQKTPKATPIATTNRIPTNKLEHLNISSNKLHWFDYAFVPNSLKSLDIHDNQIDSVENYYSLRDGFQLEFLDASRNRIRALGVLSLLPSLKTIILEKNKISDIGHNTFLNKDNLTHVDLRGNQLSVLNLASLAVSKTLKNGKH